jgi:hypothetical protein
VDIHLLAVGRDVLLRELEDFAGGNHELIVLLILRCQRGRIEVEVRLSDDLFEGPAEQLAKAPVGKGNKADIELIQTDVAGVGTQFGDAQADYNSGKYMVAKGKVEAVIAKARSLMGEISMAAQKKRMGTVPSK